MPSSPDHKAQETSARARLIEEMREAFLDMEHAELREDQRAKARERFEAAYRAVLACLSVNPSPIHQSGHQRKDGDK